MLAELAIGAAFSLQGADRKLSAFLHCAAPKSAWRPDERGILATYSANSMLAELAAGVGFGLPRCRPKTVRVFRFASDQGELNG